MPSSIAPTTFTTSPLTPPSLSLPQSAFLAANPHLSHLMAGALIFRIDSNSPLSTPQLQTLLIRRAPTDTYPLKWERPAGGVSGDDESLLGCAVREVWEETGLMVTRVVCPVRVGEVDTRGEDDGDEGGKLDGWDSEEGDESEESQEGDEGVVVVLWKGEKWGVVTVLVEVAEDLSLDGVVRLSPEEHEEWMWVCEEEVRSRRDRNGLKMEYTSKAVWQTVLEGFRVKREIDGMGSS